MIRLQALGWTAVAFAIAACHSTTRANETTTTGASVDHRGGATRAPDYSPMDPAPASIDVPRDSLGSPAAKVDGGAPPADPAFRGSSFGNDPPPASTFQGTSFGNDNTAPPR
jgi:hypothetical protein